MLRKGISFVFIIVLVFISSSCNFDLYYDKRPFDYGSAKWVCEDPSAWFVVDESLEDYYSPEGELMINDQAIQFKLLFVHQTKLVFLCVIKPGVSYDEGYHDGGFDGECTFSPEKLTIKIDKETDTLLNGQYDELIFLREET